MKHECTAASEFMCGAGIDGAFADIQEALETVLGNVIPSGNAETLRGRIADRFAEHLDTAFGRIVEQIDDAHQSSVGEVLENHYSSDYVYRELIPEVIEDLRARDVRTAYPDLYEEIQEEAGMSCPVCLRGKVRPKAEEDTPAMTCSNCRRTFRLMEIVS